EAEAAGEKDLAAYARIELALLTSNTNPSVPYRDHRAAMEDALAVLEEEGQGRRWVRGLTALGTMNMWMGNAGGAKACFERARLAACRIDPRWEGEMIWRVNNARFWGETPAEEGLRSCRDDWRDFFSRMGRFRGFERAELQRAG